MVQLNLVTVVTAITEIYLSYLYIEADGKINQAMFVNLIGSIMFINVNLKAESKFIGEIQAMKLHLIDGKSIR